MIRSMIKPVTGNCLTFMFPFLTLDQSTLFYWTLSDISQKKRSSTIINEWASAIPRHAKLATKSIPSLTSRSSAPSSLTKNVNIIRHQLDAVKVTAESASNAVPFDQSESMGGLSDNDEMKGEERVAAINSPPKGKKRVTSSVSPFVNSS